VADGWVVALAVATFAGSLAAADGHVARVPLVLAATVLALALATRRPGALCLGAALLAASLGQRSIAGLEAPLDTGPVTAEVTLVSDPSPDAHGGVAVDVRLDGRRLRAHARLAPAAALDDRLAGERILVVGDVRPPGPAESALRYRHLAGRLEVDAVVGWRPGGGVTRVANGLRRTLARGAEVMSDRHASLLAGLTLGDDRDQPADMTDAFRAAGLTHILAVSGQNVAFVMVVVAPVLGRLRFGPRLAVTLAVLAGFALVTRFEPSVLRATAMAAVAATGTALGRPASTLRVLALGVGGILLVDPLLATSLGFRLSVAGAAGIVVGAGRIERMLPGPRWLAAPLSVTLAAQLAVAPFLVAAFGAVPVASLPCRPPGRSWCGGSPAGWSRGLAGLRWPRPCTSRRRPSWPGSTASPRPLPAGRWASCGPGTWRSWPSPLRPRSPLGRGRTGPLRATASHRPGPRGAGTRAPRKVAPRWW
jgi:competence protein ComEC